LLGPLQIYSFSLDVSLHTMQQAGRYNRYVLSTINRHFSEKELTWQEDQRSLYQGLFWCCTCSRQTRLFVLRSRSLRSRRLPLVP